MREQTLIPGFATRFCFVLLTLGWMPMFTKRSVQVPFKIICTFVGERHHGYFCLGYFFSSTHFDLVIRLAQKARGGSAFWFLGTIVTLLPETALVLLSNTGLLLSTGNKYIFIFRRHSFPFDS